MAKTLGTLATSLRKRANEIGQLGSNAASNAALAIVKNLTFTATPVDTSQALSNWKLSIGIPNATFIRPYVPGEDGSTRRASANVAYSKAKAEVKTKKPGQDIWISNVAPYIVLLNEGSSKQAPAGFVERAVLIARKMGVNTRKVA